MATRPTGRLRKPAFALLGVVMLAGACAGSDGDPATAAIATTNEAVATAIATTAPLDALQAAESEDVTVPEVSDDVAQEPAGAPATTEPAAIADEPAPEPQAEATAIPPAAVPAPTEAPAAPTTPPAPAAATIGLPDVSVVNLLSRQTSSLAGYSPSGPTLLWFWAPH